MMRSARFRSGGHPALRPLNDADAQAVFVWPQYAGEFAPLDYALRPGGWLDMFPPSPGTRRFAVTSDGTLVAFTLLTDITTRDAEFYIAVHPDKTGAGYGRIATELTLDTAFSDLLLTRVYLKVRTWHKRGIALYGSVGFHTTGETEQDVQGKPVNFFVMEITAADHAARRR